MIKMSETVIEFIGGSSRVSVFYYFCIPKEDVEKNEACEQPFN